MLTPKFEHISGTLCIMLPQPIPLTKDAKFPCVVRLIQDDSPIGMLNDYEILNLGKKTIIAIGLSHAKVVKNNENYYWEFYTRYEILGYPVQDGSAEWALYQVINGKIVTMDDCGIYKIQDGKLWECFPDDSNEWKVVADDGIAYWLKYIHDLTGWQLYEPKPELKYKVGDWVEHKESKEQATIRRIMSYGAIEIEFAYSTESDIYQANDFHNDFRKLSSSEIIVRIGCLSGTIAKSSDPNHFLMWHSSPSPDHDYSIIKFTALDEQTRKLVEGLLEAQRKGD